MIKEIEKPWNKDIGCPSCRHTAKEHNEAKDNEHGMACPSCETRYSLLPKNPFRTIDTFSKYDIGDRVELVLPLPIGNLPCKISDVLYSFMDEGYHYSVELDKPLWDKGTRVFAFGKIPEDSLH